MKCSGPTVFRVYRCVPLYLKLLFERWLMLPFFYWDYLEVTDPLDLNESLLLLLLLRLLDFEDLSELGELEWLGGVGWPMILVL